MRILTFMDYYLPGHKSGGPVRSVANLVERLSGRFHFQVVTRDRDWGDDHGYAGVRPGTWMRDRGLDVLYLEPRQLRPQALARVLRETPTDVLYLNSVFSRPFSMLPLAARRLGRIGSVPVVLAPRGEFSPGALGLKTRRKRAYLAAARAAGLFDGVTWQASSAFEADDIRRVLGTGSGPRAPRVLIASDVPPPPLPELPEPGRSKAPGTLRVLFLSRVTRMKNLHAAVRMLRGVRGSVEFAVYGPIEDETYWKECQAAAAGLGPGVRMVYHGPVAHRDVVRVYREHDLFFLPTLGENYGHAIHEALSAGCPVLISDRTPWRGLQERGVGWDLPLDAPRAFTDALQRLVDMDAAEHQALRERASAYGREWSEGGEALRQNAELFEAAASPS